MKVKKTFVTILILSLVLSLSSCQFPRIIQEKTLEEFYLEEVQEDLRNSFLESFEEDIFSESEIFINSDDYSYVEVYSHHEKKIVHEFANQSKISEIIEHMNFQNWKPAFDDTALIPLYTFTFYKPNVAKFFSADKEENFSLTLYENSNMVLLALSENTVKNMVVPKDALKFLFEAEEEDVSSLLRQIQS